MPSKVWSADWLITYRSPIKAWGAGRYMELKGLFFSNVWGREYPAVWFLHPDGTLNTYHSQVIPRCSALYSQMLEAGRSGLESLSFFPVTTCDAGEYLIDIAVNQ